ncbi:MAG: hypothetical protein GY878_21180 [Fuerstiella sp.]|nr:hypothetical protein [Fuerstiella sp.]
MTEPYVGRDHCFNIRPDGPCACGQVQRIHIAAERPKILFAVSDDQSYTHAGYHVGFVGKPWAPGDGRST